MEGANTAVEQEYTRAKVQKEMIVRIREWIWPDAMDMVTERIERRTSQNVNFIVVGVEAKIRRVHFRTFGNGAEQRGATLSSIITNCELWRTCIIHLRLHFLVSTIFRNLLRCDESQPIRTYRSRQHPTATPRCTRTIDAISLYQ